MCSISNHSLLLIYLQNGLWIHLQCWGDTYNCGTLTTIATNGHYMSCLVLHSLTHSFTDTWSRNHTFPPLQTRLTNIFRRLHSFSLIFSASYIISSLSPRPQSCPLFLQQNCRFQLLVKPTMEPERSSSENAARIQCVGAKRESLKCKCLPRRQHCHRAEQASNASAEAPLKKKLLDLPTYFARQSLNESAGSGIQCASIPLPQNP